MTPLLDVEHISKAYREVQALDDCSVSVGPGQLVGFLGPNGAGKTTTMRSIMQLVSVDSGTIRWNGQPIRQEDRAKIGYLPQERGLYARMGVREQVVYFARLAGVGENAEAEAERWIDRVGLSDRSDDHVQTLSVGNQQRVQLAVALVHQPALLVLDEPFAGLDPVAVSTLQSIITEQVADGVGVLFSSHQLDLVQDLCEDVVVINKGSTVATGTVAGLRASSPRRVFEVEFVDATIDWQPVELQINRLHRKGGIHRFEVDAEQDPGVLVAAAGAHGTIASVRFEPPDLAEVFLELVGR